MGEKVNQIKTFSYRHASLLAGKGDIWPKRSLLIRWGVHYLSCLSGLMNAFTCYLLMRMIRILFKAFCRLVLFAAATRPSME